MRWAMVMTVTPLHSLDIVLCSREAVWVSMLAVHSSRHRIFDDLSRARARHISCLCPTEKEHPDSFTFESNPPALSTSALTLHFSKISQILQSSLNPRGSRLFLWEPQLLSWKLQARPWLLNAIWVNSLPQWSLKQKRALRNNSEARTKLSNRKMIYVNSIHHYLSTTNRGKPEKGIQYRRFSGTSSSYYSYLVRKNKQICFFHQTDKLKSVNKVLAARQYMYLHSSLDCKRNVVESRRQGWNVSHCHIVKLNQSLNWPLTAEGLATGNFFLRHIHVL